MANVTTELLYEILKKIQNDVLDLKKLRGEVREGFASLRSHLAATHSDQSMLERRVVSTETDLEKIKRRLDIVDDPE